MNDLTPPLFRRIGEILYGPTDWDRALAYELGIREYRTVRGWGDGTIPIPPALRAELVEIVCDRARVVGKQAALYRARSDALDRLWAEMSGTIAPAA